MLGKQCRFVTCELGINWDSLAEDEENGEVIPLVNRQAGCYISIDYPFSFQLRFREVDGTTWNGDELHLVLFKKLAHVSLQSTSTLEEERMQLFINSVEEHFNGNNA